MNLIEQLVAFLRPLISGKSGYPDFRYYIVTPRQGRHTIRRKLLRAFPQRLSNSPSTTSQ